jgi:hypothetical protein
MSFKIDVKKKDGTPIFSMRITEKLTVIEYPCPFCKTRQIMYYYDDDNRCLNCEKGEIDPTITQICPWCRFVLEVESPSFVRNEKNLCNLAIERNCNQFLYDDDNFHDQAYEIHKNKMGLDWG